MWTMTPGVFVPEVCAIIMIRTFHFQISAPLSHSPYLCVCVWFLVCVFICCCFSGGGGGGGGVMPIPQYIKEV